MAFLYTGPDAVQTGVAEGAIDPVRAAVTRGQVLGLDGSPLADVVVTALGHPEFGQSRSRSDGTFDLVVNGGGRLTVVYEKAGFLQVQRSESVPWRDFAILPTVALTPLDSQVTSIDLSGGTAPLQVARGSVQTDADGSRRATLLFPQGVQASMSLPDGSTQPLSTLAVRATEYTVGESGPLAMPGTLPATSGYTYAVELSVDQAIAAGATRVDFTKAVPVYVENFLDFPVGMAVPAGYYDRELGQWVASDNGQVIRILSETADDVVLDTDGDGSGDSESVLTALGITASERGKLVELYDAGQSFWRTPVTHFTPWDYNWPYGPPEGSKAPATDPNGVKTGDVNKPNECEGSVIGMENQTLGEVIPVTGAPFSLVYQSERTAGRKADRTLTIPLSGQTLPPLLKRIDLEIKIAGQVVRQTYNPAANLITQFQWDGRDAYGRDVSQSVTAHIQIGYVYDSVYYRPADFQRAFAVPGVSSISGFARSEVTISQDIRIVFDRFNALSQGFGGTTPSILHRYDLDSGTMHFGSGETLNQDSIPYGSVGVSAGTGQFAFSGDGGPASRSELNEPTGVAVASDGTVYIADRANHRIRRIGGNGLITTVAGTGERGFAGDGGLATLAQFDGPTGVAVGQDGSLYVADTFNHRIRRIGPDGVITTIAGIGVEGYGGDGGSPTQAQINQPNYVAVRPDGTIFFTDYANNRVRSFRVNGVIRTEAGTGIGEFGGDGGRATEASLNEPSGIAFDTQGNTYIADTGNNRVRRISVDGLISTFGGTGEAAFGGDGGAAMIASLNRPYEVAFGRDGSLFVADGGNNRVRRIGTDGAITTVAGGGVRSPGATGDIAMQVNIGFLVGIAAAPDGSIYVADLENSRLHRVSSVLPNTFAANLLVPSQDASELFQFNPAGRHVQTLNALTGSVVHAFGYDGAGRLISVRDAHGNETRIERDAVGNPTAVVAPFGQRTTLSTVNGYLTSVANPAGEAYTLEYTSGGLLTGFTDPLGNRSTMTYDELGRLTRDQDPVNGFTGLSRIELSGGGYQVTSTNAVGGTRQYIVQPLPDGTKRRTAIDGRGFATVTITGADGQKQTTAPDGTMTTTAYAPDPRYGMMAPVVSSQTVATPSGLTSTSTGLRSATFATPGDPSSALATLTSTSVVNGRTFTSVYDAVADTVTSVSAAGRVATTTLDDLGRPILVSVPSIEPTRYAYDSRGRIASITQGNRTVTNSYDAQGRLASITDPLNRVTRLEYDAAGRVVKQTQPDGTFILFAYDIGGNLVGLTPPGQPQHAFAYDSNNQVVGSTPPPVGATDDSTRYVYNLAHQLVSEALPGGQIISYAYCDCGRLTGIDTPWGEYAYTYSTTTGALSSLASPGGFSVSFGYDGGLLTSETVTGPVAGRIDRTFDSDFRVVGESINGANGVGFAYDADGLLTRAGELTISRSSDLGQITGSYLGTSTSGVAESVNYNTFGEVRGYSATFNAEQRLSFEYTRDALGRITGRTEVVSGTAKTFGYGYDLNGQLISVTENGLVTQRYAYDANGNRLSLTTPAGTLSGAYDAQDRLLSYGTKTYSYDALGSLSAVMDSATGQTTRYTYDAFENLTRVELPDGRVIEYLIDGQNRRVGKKVNGVLVEGLLYDGQLRPVAKLDASGNISERFVYATGINVPAYMTKAGVNYRLVTDHLGSVRLVINVQTGEVAQRLDYDAFGRVTMDTNPGFQPFGFAGGLYDTDTGLVRFGARDYDAESGRWTAKDPIGVAGGINLYQYADNSPTLYIDPTGRFCQQTAGQCANDSGFKPYNGIPAIFHCGYDGYLSNEQGSDGLQSECFYDGAGNLATGLCGGSPNEYDSSEDPFLHTVYDSGGVLSVAAIGGLIGSLYNLIVPDAY